MRKGQGQGPSSCPSCTVLFLERVETKTNRKVVCGGMWDMMRKCTNACVRALFSLPVETCLWSDAVDGCWTGVDGILCVDGVWIGWCLCVCLCADVAMVAQALNYDGILHRRLSISLLLIDESTFLHLVMFMCNVSKQTNKLQMKKR